MKKSPYLLAALLLTGCAAGYPDDELAEYDVPDRPYTTPMTADEARAAGTKPRASDIFKTKVVSAEQAAKDAVDVQGRFGQKEKRFLRKGLNAPADSMKYDESVPKPSVSVVRGLEVKPQNRQAEQKILNDIVASQPQPEKKADEKAVNASPVSAAEKKTDKKADAAPATPTSTVAKKKTDEKVTAVSATPVPATVTTVAKKKTDKKVTAVPAAPVSATVTTVAKKQTDKKVDAVPAAPVPATPVPATPPVLMPVVAAEPKTTDAFMLGMPMVAEPAQPAKSAQPEQIVLTAPAAAQPERIVLTAPETVGENAANTDASSAVVLIAPEQPERIVLTAPEK